MSNPSQLFELSKHNAIIYQFLQIWQNGGIEWEKMLFEIHKHLAIRCEEINHKFDLNWEFIKAETFTLNVPINELQPRNESETPDFRSIEIQRQEYLINSINKAVRILEGLESESRRKIIDRSFVHRVTEITS